MKTTATENAARYHPQPPLEPHEQVALVTGASSGIGLALVDELLENPAFGLVYAGCRKPQFSVALRERMVEATILSWSDTRIVARMPVIPYRVTVKSVFGSATANTTGRRVAR